MDLTEAEDIKKRWQEYTEELYKKELHDPDNQDGVISHLEPDILECESQVDLRKHHHEQHSLMYVCGCFWAFLVAQMVKNPPVIWETWTLFLGWEDPLEKEMATHSSILAWKIPWTKKPGRLQSMGSQRVGHD